MINFSLILPNNRGMNAYKPYEIIFNALVEVGKSEAKAERIIADVITEQRCLDDYADNIHKILKDTSKVRYN